MESNPMEDSFKSMDSKMSSVSTVSKQADDIMSLLDDEMENDEQLLQRSIRGIAEDQNGEMNNSIQEFADNVN